MLLDEFLKINVLLDIYESLLSAKQKSYLIDYYENNLNLVEIASKNEISRQAVYDNIKRGVKLLNTYEEKLGILKRKELTKKKLKELKNDFRMEKLDELIEDLF